MNDLDLQATLKQSISFVGPGLHTAKRHKITLLPAEAGTGIIFKKSTKKGGGVKIPAHVSNTKPLPLCTCLADDNGNQVRTVEHLLAALYACRIDNLMIQVEGSEIPVMDGSAQPFIREIDRVGVVQQDQKRKIFRITKPVEVSEDKRWIKIEPADTFSLDIGILLKGFGHLRWKGELTPELFKQDMSSARTFGRLKDGILAKLTLFQKDPICLGANTNTALVLNSKHDVVNKGGLRMDDEMIFHRILDLMGDLMLSGGHMRGKITANSSAHRLNHALIKSIFEQEAYELVEP